MTSAVQFELEIGFVDQEDFGFDLVEQACGGKILSMKLLPKEWKENFGMSRTSLLKLSEELLVYILICFVLL